MKLSSILIFILGFVLISSSFPSFDQESFAACPIGSHKSSSGDCQEGTTTENPRLAQEDTGINPADLTNTSESPNGQTQKLYSNPLLGIEFKYPSNWPSDHFVEEGNTVSLIFALYVDDITIALDDLAENTTLQKYLRQYLSGNSLVDLKSLKINQTQITAEKLPALKAEYQTGVGSTGMKTISYLTIKNNTAYIITYKFWEGHVPDKTAGFESMINSFTIS